MAMSTETTAQIGVNAVESIFLKMGWFFRRQLESDVGIDAHVEPVGPAGPTGQLVALQIKSGTSFFRGRGNEYIYQGRARHLSYWENFALPVLLVMHNPETGETVWRRIERHIVTVSENGNWSVSIPKNARLTETSAAAIIGSMPRSDPESRRRQRMVLDADIIRRASTEITFLRLEEWVNKSLRWRGAEIVFDDPKGDAEVHYPFMAAGYSIGEILAELFPWADANYERPPEDYSGEVEVHTFELEINDLGRALLLLEDFYRNGAPAAPDPSAPEDEDFMTDDEWDEMMYRRALDKDPY